MSSLILNVDCLPGSPVEVCCADMIALAKKLDVMVRTSFNGVSILADANDRSLDLATEWEKRLRRKGK